MSSLKSRVDALYRKTHMFVSYRELAILRDYYQANSLKCLTIPRGEEAIELYEELADLNPAFRSILNMYNKEFARPHAHALWRQKLLEATQDCIRFPRGRWIRKRNVDPTLRAIDFALTHFDKENKYRR
jgi:hypothetical protein